MFAAQGPVLFPTVTMGHSSAATAGWGPKRNLHVAGELVFLLGLWDADRLKPGKPGKPGFAASVRLPP